MIGDSRDSGMRSSTHENVGGLQWVGQHAAIPRAMNGCPRSVKIHGSFRQLLINAVTGNDPLPKAPPL